MTAANNDALRLGVDFGYGYTGVSLLDSANRALGAAVVKHDSGLSELLIKRRDNRAARRRAKSRRRRLRDCYALLAEMDCAPAPLVKNEKGDETERKKKLPANRLYALMHRRGWDYADVLELLVDKENAKPGSKVAEVDHLLILNGAPANLQNPPMQGKKISAQEFARRKQNYEAAKQRHDGGEPPVPNDLRYLQINESCLGYLSELAKEESALAKRLEKKHDDETEEELSRVRYDLERETKLWQNDKNGKSADLGEMQNKIGERITAACTGARKPPADEKREELTGDIMAILGLVDSRDRFKDGKVYRPDRNQHRSKMLAELGGLFAEVEKTPAAQERAREIAARDGREVGEMIASWKTRMEEIAERQYRKKRFENRKPGKCPAKISGGDQNDDRRNEKESRCGKNLPKRARLDIRKLLFEMEARQMNIVVAGQKKGKKPETRKLSDDKIKELINCVEWDAKGGKVKQAWDAFFKRNKPLPPKQDDESGEEHRGKKDALLDIVRGAQAGRANLCGAHIAERLELVKRRNRLVERERDDGEAPDKLQKEWEGWQEKWNALHGERIIDETDAPPSLRQKVDRVCAVAKRLIKNADCEGRPIVHIGIESARFDINALSAREGRKLKNKPSYSKPRGSDLSALIRAQDGFCFYCERTLGADVTVDHVFPKARGGGNAWLNRVAACRSCNISKAHLDAGAVNAAALAALNRRHPGKADYIKKRLEPGNKLPPDNLAAPVQTMFGAKVLRGELAKVFEQELSEGAREKSGEKGGEQFPKIRAADAVYLRGQWFPFMARQKKALRAAGDRLGGGDAAVAAVKGGDRSDKFIAYAGGEFNFRADKETLKKSWGILRADSAECKSPAFDVDICDGALVVSCRGELGDDDVGKYWLRVEGECERVFSLAEDENERTFNLGAGVVAEVVDGKSKGVCAEIVEKQERGADGKTVSRTKLILRAADADESKAKKSKPKKREAAIKIDARYLPPIIVCPRRADKSAKRPEDPIYKFHHIMDAAVVAANVNWEKISRLARAPQERSRRDNAVLMRQARDADRPDLSLIAKSREDGDFCAPPIGDWLIVDRRDKSGPKAAKTKREPVRYKRDDSNRKMVVSQRVPLDRLTRKEIERIAPGGEKIQAELRAAWADIDKETEGMTDEERTEFRKKFLSGTSDKAIILAAWFLRLPQNHFLRPNRPGAPRSVRVRNYQQPAPFALRRRECSALGKREHLHYFGREDPWGSVAIFRAADGAEFAFRRRPDFYINSVNLDEWDYDPKDKRDKRPPPDAARQVRAFKRRDWVRVVAAEGEADLPGLWRLIKFASEKKAALEAADDEARAAGAASSQSKTFIGEGYVNVDYCRLRHAEKSK